MTTAFHSSSKSLKDWREERKKKKRREFPGRLVVRTLGFHCQGSRLNPWSGNKVCVYVCIYLHMYTLIYMYNNYSVSHCLTIIILLDISFQNISIIKNTAVILLVFKYMLVLLILITEDKLLVVELLVMSLYFLRMSILGTSLEKNQNVKDLTFSKISASLKIWITSFLKDITTKWY